MTWCSRNSAVPGFVLASSAIRRRFVYRFAGFMPLPVFPVDGSLLATPPFPPSGPGEARFPALVSTMKALRLPIRLSPVAYSFASAAPHEPSSLCVRRSAPGRAEVPPRPGLGCAGGPQCRLLRVDTNGFSQVFRRSILCLCSAPGPRSNRRALAMTATSMLPPLGRRRRLRRCLISGLIRSFGTR